MVIVPTIAQDWEQKPFTTWNPNDVTKVLTDSPWVSLCLNRLTGGSGGSSGRSLSYFRIRLLSAAPIRMAYLRYVIFEPDIREMTINYKDLADEDTANAAKSLYERFVKANPDDIRLKGSDEYIILSITATSYNRDIHIPAAPWPPRYEYALAFHDDLPLSDLTDHTFLSTDSGRKVRIVRFEPSSYDRLGAKFYFPRHLPTGENLVTPRDKVLHFRTNIDGKRIKADFDLRKLLYNGKLEL